MVDMTDLMITIRPDGTTAIDRYPDGFPVDGDALSTRSNGRSRMLQKRAAVVLLADPGAMQAARESLGKPLVQGEQLDDARTVQLIKTLHPGGIARFLAGYWSEQAGEAPVVEAA